jgi:hypothetical protein
LLRSNHLDRLRGSLSPIGNPELCIDMVNMIFCRRFADGQLPRDLLVRKPLAD